MTKRWILSVLAALVLSIAGVSAVLAQGASGDDASSGVSEFSARAAELLGLDESVGGNAINQASSALKEDAVRTKLAVLVEEGELTQEEADLKLQAIFAGDKELCDKEGTVLQKLAAMVEKGQLNSGGSRS